jgi:hypothetical protein
VNTIPEYFVTYGGESWFVAVRRPSGSLRRAVSTDLPLCGTRLEALEHLACWLHCKACNGRLVDRAAYREQLARVKQEIVASGSTPHPGDTGWAFGIEGYGLEREQRAKEVKA